LFDEEKISQKYPCLCSLFSENFFQYYQRRFFFSFSILSLNSASSESLPEVVDSSNDLEIDPELGILDEESEAWINKVDKTVFFFFLLNI